MKNRNILGWEIGGFFFILVFGTGLHFAFELTNLWTPAALFASVNESTWEHLKMVFWPGFIFFLVQYHFLKGRVSNYWTAKALCLFIMPLVIAIGWYAAVSLLGENIFSVNIALFVGAIFTGQLVSYRLLTAGKIVVKNPYYAIFAILLLTFAFASFTYFPPKIFLFEHMDLANTGQYGILDSYEGLLIFSR
jgi:hypothetical protein